MDSIASGAGLSPSLITVFRNKKDYKANLCMFRETAVVWLFRVLDVLFEEGVLKEDDWDL